MQDKLNTAYRFYFQALTHGNLQELTNSAYQLLGCPVLVNDDISYNLSQAPNHTIGDLDWDYLVKNKIVSNTFFSHYYKKYISRSDQIIYPILINDGNMVQKPQLFSVLRHEGHVLGYSAVILPSGKVSEQELQIVRLFNAAAVTILANSANTSSVSPMRLNSKQAGQVIFDVLESSGLISPTQQAFVNNLAVRYAPPYQILLSQWRNGQADTVGASILCDKLQKEAANVISILYQNKIVILCCGDTPVENSELISRLLDILKLYPLRTSISTKFQDMAKTYEYYRQSALTLRAGLLISPEKKVFPFEEISPAQIFTAFSQDYPIKPFIHPILERIYFYDKNNGSEYLKTLDKYLFCMMNSKSAAQELHIHTNTLLYRINRIQELFEIDFKNYHQLYNLTCGLGLYRASDTINDLE